MKLLLLLILLTVSKAVKVSTKITVESLELNVIDYFSYKNGGDFTFEISSETPVRDHQMLLFIIAKQDECKRLAHTCVYDLKTTNDICKTYSSKELDNKILYGYPILIPSYLYFHKNNYTQYAIQPNIWKTYAKLTDTDIQSFIEQDLVVGVVKYLLFKHLIFSENNTKHIQKMITQFDGIINEDSYLYFSILNCYNSSATVNIKYSLTNPNGEELSAIDIPHKVYLIYFRLSI